MIEELKTLNDLEIFEKAVNELIDETYKKNGYY